MISLHCFGGFFGEPDGSPFVVKTMILLKMAGLEFERKTTAPFRAPKGKLPFIEDDGETIADSTFIRGHIERKYGFDFDAGLTEEQKSLGWIAEKFLEDHFYWLALADRWLDDANFSRGPAQFFNAAPAPLRPLIAGLVRRGVRKAALAQGLYRHSRDERAALARRGIAAGAALLGDKSFLFGETPSGADATLGAFTMGALCPLFDSPTREAVEDHPNLVAYARRMHETYFG